MTEYPVKKLCSKIDTESVNKTNKKESVLLKYTHWSQAVHSPNMLNELIYVSTTLKAQLKRHGVSSRCSDMDTHLFF